MTNTNLETPGLKTPVSELLEYHDTLAEGLRSACCGQMNPLKIGKYADPTEGERLDLSVEEALEVAREDIGLLYLYA